MPTILLDRVTELLVRGAGVQVIKAISKATKIDPDFIARFVPGLVHAHWFKARLPDECAYCRRNQDFEAMNAEDADAADVADVEVPDATEVEDLAEDVEDAAADDAADDDLAPPVLDDSVRVYHDMIRRLMVDFGDEVFDKIVEGLTGSQALSQAQRKTIEAIRANTLDALRGE